MYIYIMFFVNTYIMLIICIIYVLFNVKLFFSIPHLFKHLIFLCKTYERYETNNCFSQIFFRVLLLFWFLRF